jgi:hypothetical protein
MTLETLGASDRETIDRIVKERGGDQTRDEFFRSKLEWSKTTVEKYSGLAYYQIHYQNIKRNLECGDSEAEAVVAGEIYSWDLVARGVARRIVKDSPSELACALSLAARLKRLRACETGPAKDREYEIWEAMQALAAGDIEGARAYFMPGQRRITKGHHPSAITYNAVMGILREDERLLRTIDDELEYSDAPLPLRAIHKTLLGIIRNDAEMVADGLDAVMRKFRVFQLFGGCRPLAYELIISFNAHGLAELAWWRSRDLLRNFNVDGPLPWDRDYFKSLRKANGSRKYLDLSKCSPLLTTWIAALEEPPWSRAWK